ncbi:hypothetical protein F8S13_25415 [Chloroflexia bacterium SDU3-3]|nr:hypothetical protein F8S13_25415 [Chloroflexia bacterium SDU3-3]
MSEQQTYFRDAAVEAGGQVYTFSVADGQEIEGRGHYWHGPGEPSTWLVVGVFLEARSRVGDAGADVACELAAQALGISVDKLRQSIEWHENYMRWHDGDYEYRIL